MKFCSNCSSRMVLKRIKSEDKVVMTFECIRCCSSLPVDEPVTKSEIEPIEDQIKVFNEDVDVKTMPTLDEVCPKCENREAYWWLLQTRGGDEATTQFYRCTKCNFTWRKYV